MSWDDRNVDGRAQPDELDQISLLDFSSPTGSGSDRRPDRFRTPSSRSRIRSWSAYDHQLGQLVSLGVSYQYRRGERGMGFENMLVPFDVYTPLTVNNPLGRGPLQSSTCRRRCAAMSRRILTNQETRRASTTAWSSGCSRRFSGRWQLQGSLTIGEANGMATDHFQELLAGSESADQPATAPIRSTRDISARIGGSYLLPYDILAAVNYRFNSGRTLHADRALHRPEPGRRHHQRRAAGYERGSTTSTCSICASRSGSGSPRKNEVGLVIDTFNLFNINSDPGADRAGGHDEREHRRIRAESDGAPDHVDHAAADDAAGSAIQLLSDACGRASRFILALAAAIQTWVAANSPGRGVGPQGPPPRVRRALRERSRSPPRRIRDINAALDAGALTSERLVRALSEPHRRLRPARAEDQLDHHRQSKALVTARSLDLERREGPPQPPARHPRHRQGPPEHRGHADDGRLHRPQGRGAAGRRARHRAAARGRRDHPGQGEHERLAGAIQARRRQLDGRPGHSIPTTPRIGRAIEQRHQRRDGRLVRRCGVGSETGTSIRTPTSDGAIVGLAPTEGLVGTKRRHGEHLYPRARRPDVPQYSRCGRDARPDGGARRERPDDGAGAGASASGVVHASLDDDGLRGARIGVLREMFRSGPAHAEGLAVTRQAILALHKAGAAVSDPVSLGMNLDRIRMLKVNYWEAETILEKYLSEFGPAAPFCTIRQLRRRNTRRRRTRSSPSIWAMRLGRIPITNRV